MALFNEGIQLLSKMLGNSDVNYSQSRSSTSIANFDGKFFKIRRASFAKHIIKIPITIAAKQDKMMKIAANYADVWECSYLSPYEFFTLNERFERLSRKEENNEESRKRQNKVVNRSIELDVLIASTAQELDYKGKVFAVERGPDVYNQILKKGLVGNSAEIRSRIQEYVDVSINQFFLAFQDPLDLKSIELFMDAVTN